MRAKDPRSIIDNAIDRKEGRDPGQPTRRCPALSERARLHDLLQAARISIAEADEKNRDLGSTIKSLLDLLGDAASSLLEAAELLEEQAKQLL